MSEQEYLLRVHVKELQTLGDLLLSKPTSSSNCSYETKLLSLLARQAMQCMTTTVHVYLKTPGMSKGVPALISIFGPKLG